MALQLGPGEELQRCEQRCCKQKRAAVEMEIGSPVGLGCLDCSGAEKGLDGSTPATGLDAQKESVLGLAA